MYFTYVLANPKWQLYVGYCRNLTRRKSDHDHEEVYTTRRLGGPWNLIYYEACLNEFDAKKRERYLKTGRGGQFIEDRLKYYFKSKR